MRLMTYNIEHFNRAFAKDNSLNTDEDSVEKLTAVAQIIAAIDPDLIGITEAPNSGGDQSAVDKLQNFAAHHNLRQNAAMTGYDSRGTQEIALLYDPTVVTAVHDPGGSTTAKRNPSFNRQFEVDSDGDGIKEIYNHYRPPLEARITRADGGADFWVIVVHAKSKGIFDAMDRANFDRTSERNRRKLFAECTSIRQRVDEFLDQNRPTVVMGDINDGPGFDFYEKRFGRSAVEIIMGDLWNPRGVLNNHIGRPKWGRFGWEPSSARFQDTFTHDMVNVIIDHIMASQQITPLNPDAAKVWNPYADRQSDAVKKRYKVASDHFPVTLDIA